MSYLLSGRRRIWEELSSGNFSGLFCSSPQYYDLIALFKVFVFCLYFKPLLLQPFKFILCPLTFFFFFFWGSCLIHFFFHPHRKVLGGGGGGTPVTCSLAHRWLFHVSYCLEVFWIPCGFCQAFVNVLSTCSSVTLILFCMVVCHREDFNLNFLP